MVVNNGYLTYALNEYYLRDYPLDRGYRMERVPRRFWNLLRWGRGREMGLRFCCRPPLEVVDEGGDFGDVWGGGGVDRVPRECGEDVYGTRKWDIRVGLYNSSIHG
jgi:hypothetical protein